MSTTTHCYICHLPFEDDAPFAGGQDQRREAFYADSGPDAYVVDAHAACGIRAGLHIA